MVSLYYSFKRSSLNFGIQHGTAHPIQNIEKQNLSKASFTSYLNSYQPYLESEPKPRQVMKELYILNIYQLNIYNVSGVMFQVKSISKSYKENFTLFHMIIMQKAVCTTLKILASTQK